MKNDVIPVSPGAKYRNLTAKSQSLKVALCGLSIIGFNNAFTEERGKD
jgi:hypothetical protein